MQEKLNEIISYYRSKGLAYISKLDVPRNFIKMQSFYGVERTERFINLVAIKVPHSKEPMIASENERKKLYGHIEDLGVINITCSSQIALLVIFCEEDDRWFKMDLNQIKKYWTDDSLFFASPSKLEKLELAYPVKLTTHGIDFLNLIRKPFKVAGESDNPFDGMELKGE